MRLFPAIICLLLAAVSFAQTKDAPAANQTSSPKEPSSQATTKIDPAKEADIRHLFEVGGTRDLVTEMMSAMETNIKPLMTNALPPGEYREKLVNLFFEKFHSKADAGQVLNLAVPVYDKYLSDAEIRGLIEFYMTPLGQKAIKVLPKIMSECQQAGQQWGQQLGSESMMEVLQEHPDLAKALENAKGQTPPQ